MDAAASNASESDKTAKDGEISSHEATLTSIAADLNTAKEARDAKDELIKSAAKQREQDEYDAMKQERDEAFYDM